MDSNEKDNTYSQSTSKCYVIRLKIKSLKVNASKSYVTRILSHAEYNLKYLHDNIKMVGWDLA